MKTQTNQVITLTSAVIARGQTAWSRLKATAAEQRELWRQVGEALLVGRRLNPSNQGFSRWCQENGFDDLKKDTRADAMWLAENWSALSGHPITESHPNNIRKWHREQQTQASLPDDIPVVLKETVAVLSKPESKRMAKLLNRAKSNDEGSPIAKKHLESICKAKELTVEQLEEAVSVTTPEEYYGLTPAYQEFAKGLRDDVRFP